MLLKACLNGSRTREEHESVPVTADEIARDAAAVVRAGAQAVHVHVRDSMGNETFNGDDVAATLDALRQRVHVPIGVSTGAWILPDLADRITAIRSWPVLPDFASVNFHEDGAEGIAEELLERGVAVEAGLSSPAAAVIFAGSDLAARCLRILLEPMDQETGAAVATVRGIESALADAVPGIPRLLHGFDTTAWTVLDVAATLDYDLRIGLEDTTSLPDGSRSAGNEELVRTAAERIPAR